MDEKILLDHHLAKIASKVEDILGDLLCDSDEDFLCPFAEQHFLAFWDNLNVAKRHLELAKLHRTRAIAEVQMREYKR